MIVLIAFLIGCSELQGTACSDAPSVPVAPDEVTAVGHTPGEAVELVDSSSFDYTATPLGRHLTEANAFSTQITVTVEQREDAYYIDPTGTPGCPENGLLEIPVSVTAELSIGASAAAEGTIRVAGPSDDELWLSTDSALLEDVPDWLAEQIEEHGQPADGAFQGRLAFGGPYLHPTASWAQEGPASIDVLGRGTGQVNSHALYSMRRDTE
jgi:hypothetical protein